MSKLTSKIIACVTIFCMLLSVSAYAGGGYGKGKKKVGFFTKIGRAIKKAAHKAATAVKNTAKKAATAVKNTAHKAATAVKTAAHNAKESIKAGAKKVSMGIRTAGAKVSNALHDSSTFVKQKITGHKNRTWVCGHYDKNGKWTSGHWRKVEDTGKPTGGNTPSQGNNPGQSGDAGQSEYAGGDYGQSGDAGQGGEYAGGDFGQSGDAGQGGEYAGGNEAAPAEESAPAESGDAVADQGSADQGSADQGSAEQGAGEASPEDPVLPEFTDNESAAFDDNTQPQEPVEQNEQTAEEQSQQSQETEMEAAQSEQTAQDSEQSSQAVQQGESEMAAQYKKDTQISLRTLGNLMDDLIVQSRSITEFKKTAKPGMSFSVEAQESVNSTYDVREKDAKLLARVIAWDIQNSNGESGKYFTYFKYKMKSTNAEQRKLISDVIEQVRSSVKHGEGHASEDTKGLYQQRLSEIANY